MKKVALAVVFTIVSLTVVSAQNYKWWAGGRTAFWAESAKGSQSGRVTAIIAPEVGYHLTNKFTLAASVGSYSYIYEDANDMHGLILNPYLRYNAFLKGNLLFFVDSGMEFGIGDIEGFQIGCKPGMDIFLSDRVTLAFQFGFAGYNDGNGIGGKNKGIGFDLSGYQSGFALFYSF